MLKTIGRALVEIGFIVFLFYSNLLMGEFERSGGARQKGLFWAVSDIFTSSNLEIAIVAAAIGYILVELLRTRLWPPSIRPTTGLFNLSALEKNRIAEGEGKAEKQ
jgi:hypothetical protein